MFSTDGKKISVDWILVYGMDAEKYVGDAQSQPCLTPHQRRLRDHFVAFMSGVLKPPLEPDEEPIVTAILRVSSGDAMIRTAVLCIGASYRLNQLPPESTEIQPLEGEKQGLLQEVETQQSLRQSTRSHRRQDREACFLSYLLLYFYEVSEGAGNTSWQLRLNEAHTILVDAVDGESGPAGTFFEALERVGIRNAFVQLFVYHDIVGSVTAARPDNPLTRLFQEHSAHMGLGVEGGRSPIGMIARIASLQSDMQAGAVPSGAAISKALSIWRDLDTRRDANHDIESDDSEEQPSTGDLHMGEAYIAASFIWLFLILHPDNVADDRVQTMVRSGLESLGAMNDMTGLRFFSLFPLFVIGVACIRVPDREELEGYADRVERIRRVGSIRVCRGVIRRAWRAYDGGEKRGWDWRRRMEAEDVSVPLA